VKGGSSPIESDDPNRASKAKKRVTPLLKKDLEAKGLTFGSPIFLRIFKESHELELWVQGSNGKFQLFRNYRIAAMSGKLGPKEKQGDFQAPEGFYFVNSGRFNPYSSYHLSFNIGYPNTYDRAHKRTGSLIMIHGKSVSIGCFAMTDSSIEEIYTLGDAALNHGQPFFRVHAFPFRMTKERLAAEADSEHIDFWNNLYEGFLAFEHSLVPPNVTVRSKRYVFEEG
tara:strand:- start:13908 stop:14585 length:678 start_codon:yes stop_codon:yes gene_type:complete